MSSTPERIISRVCPQCGRVLEESWVSCPYCGRDLTGRQKQPGITFEIPASIGSIKAKLRVFVYWSLFLFVLLASFLISAFNPHTTFYGWYIIPAVASFFVGYIIAELHTAIKTILASFLLHAPIVIVLLSIPLFFYSLPSWTTLNPADFYEPFPGAGIGVVVLTQETWSTGGFLVPFAIYYILNISSSMFTSLAGIIVRNNTRSIIYVIHAGILKRKEVLILGITMLLGGFIVLLTSEYYEPTFGVFAFFMGVFVTVGSLVEIARDKKSLQPKKKRIIGVALIVIAVGLAVPYSARIIVAPNWSFDISTDKSTYSLGEDIEITITLRNMGFITHSFKSEVSNAICRHACIYVNIRSKSEGYYVWWNSSNLYGNTSVFSLGPNQFLQRNFVWNQTRIHQPEEEIEPGVYRIEARIPGKYLEHVLFGAETYINITST